MLSARKLCRHAVWQALLLLAFVPLSSAQDIARVEAVKFGGLDNLVFFAEKVRRKEPVVIGYLGGSITLGIGASSSENSYYGKSRGVLEREIIRRGGSVTCCNAAIGGTGSAYACYRAGAQMFARKPDLLILEFAVNDGKSSDADESMESLVRQALRSNPKMGLVLFYTTTAAMEKGSYARGELPRSVNLHHKVAEHYGLAEVLCGMVVDQRYRDGSFTDATFFKDGVHPTDAGHAQYAKVLSDALLPLFDLPAPSAVPHMPPLLGKGALEYARLDPVEPKGGHEGWTTSARQPAWFERNWYGVPVWVCAAPGKPLVFSAKGKQIQLIYEGHLNVRWQSGKRAMSQELKGSPGGMPWPSSWTFPSDACPDGANITVEAVVDADAKAHGEVWGLFSLQPPHDAR